MPRALHCKSCLRLFGEREGQVMYDDAVVTELSWKALAQQHWNLPATADISQIQTARARGLELLHAQRDL